MAETILGTTGLIPKNIALGTTEVHDMYVGDTLVWSQGAGYYDCGYGCQYYTYNPGCSTCTMNYYIVDIYECGLGCSNPTATNVSIITNIPLIVGLYYWDVWYSNVFYITNSAVSGSYPVSMNPAQYYDCSSALAVIC